MPETSGAAVVYEGAAYRGGRRVHRPLRQRPLLELLPDAGYILADVAVTEGASLTQEGENFERVAIGGLVSDVTLTVSVLRIAEDFFLYTPPAEPVYGVSGEQLVLGGGIQPTQDALAAVWNTVSLRWYIGADGAYTRTHRPAPDRPQRADPVLCLRHLCGRQHRRYRLHLRGQLRASPAHHHGRRLPPRRRDVDLRRGRHADRWSTPSRSFRREKKPR